MPFLDSLDIGNRVAQLLGVNSILAVDEDTTNNDNISSAYDKLRPAELERNLWRFSIKRVALRAVDSDTMLLAPALYDATKTYLLNEVVRDGNGLVWISLQADNKANTPGGNNEAWDAYFGPLTVDLYDSTLAYYGGELVYKIDASAPSGYQIYLSLINDNAGDPATTTAWDATVQYKQDDVVSSGGHNWRSFLAVNLNQTHTDGAALWAAATTYASATDVTGSNGHVYSSAVDNNTGHDPTTDDGTYWTDSGTLTYWLRDPTITTSSIDWRPLYASLKNVNIVYPLGTGPFSQSSTRNMFRLPAGYLRQAPQDPTAGRVSPLGAPSGPLPNDWEYNGDYIVSSETGPILFRFGANVTKVSAMNSMFCEGLACRVAVAIANRMTQSHVDLVDLETMYDRFMREARAVNAIEQGPQFQPEDDFILCRA